MPVSSPGCTGAQAHSLGREFGGQRPFRRCNMGDERAVRARNGVRVARLSPALPVSQAAPKSCLVARFVYTAICRVSCARMMRAPPRFLAGQPLSSDLRRLVVAAGVGQFTAPEATACAGATPRTMRRGERSTSAEGHSSSPSDVVNCVGMPFIACRGGEADGPRRATESLRTRLVCRRQSSSVVGSGGFSNHSGGRLRPSRLFTSLSSFLASSRN